MNKVGDSLFCFGGNEPLVRALVNEDVEFLVVGGLAISWFCPERQADDMDLLVSPTTENAVRIAKSFSTLYLSGIDAHTFSANGFQVRLDKGYYADMLTPRSDGPTFQSLWVDAVPAGLFTMSVMIPSIRGLLALKEHALASAELESAKHLADICLLRAHAV